MKLSSVTRKRYTLKLLIAFRDHTVVDINLIQQLIFLGDSFKHDPTSNHKVHVVSHGVEQNPNFSLKLMMTVRCPPPPPAKTNSQRWNPTSRLIKTNIHAFMTWTNTVLAALRKDRHQTRE
jgi:hypothetical protein